MCDCNDNLNSTTIFSGPQGPVGPQGPQGSAGTNGTNGTSPLIIGSSTTPQFLTTGSKNFTSNLSLTYTLGQRIRFSSNDGSKVLEGPITAISGNLITVNIDYTKGSGTHNDWTISICGEVGQTGSAGATGATGSTGSPGPNGINAYTTIVSSTPLGGDIYELVVVRTSWMGVGQILYIENSGYYKITSIVSGTIIEVLDLQYTGNTPILQPPSIVSPGGVKGADSFMYETTDGNLIPAEGNGAYSILIRNSTDTGYEFITAVDLKAYLATLP
jgi:hypothetical protein